MPSLSKESIVLLSAVWHRLPILISGKKSGFEVMLKELLRYIPDHRKLVLIGPLPKSAFFTKSSPVVLPMDDLSFLEENILHLYDEESATDPPIELIGLIENKNILESIREKIDRGWILFTELPVSDIPNAKTYQMGNLAVHIFYDGVVDTRLEELLLKKSKNVSERAQRFIIQKKMAEIRNASQAILQEIENNRDFTQAEIEEEYEMRSLTFKKMLEITERECRLDIRPFIQLTPQEVSERLRVIAQIPGVEMIAVLSIERLIGLARYNIDEDYPLELFPQFARQAIEKNEQKGTPVKIEHQKKQYVVINTDKYQYVFVISKLMKDEAIETQIAKFFSKS